MSEDTAKTKEHWNIRAGQPIDYPGCWMIAASNADGGGWSYFRKEDGTYWEIVTEDLFPRSGGTLRVELGNNVTDAKVLAQLREYYLEWQRTKFRVEVFDCPQRGFRNFANRKSAEEHRESLVKDGVKEVNIRIVAINSEGAAL
jgi:hypothetical protein